MKYTIYITHIDWSVRLGTRGREGLAVFLPKRTIMLWRGGWGGGLEELKGGEVADRDKSVGAEYQEEGGGAAEHGWDRGGFQPGIRQTLLLLLYTQARAATSVTPDHGRNNPDSDRANWDGENAHVKSDVTRFIHARNGRRLLAVSGRKKAARPSTH